MRFPCFINFLHFSYRTLSSMPPKRKAASASSVAKKPAANSEEAAASASGDDEPVAKKGKTSRKEKIREAIPEVSTADMASSAASKSGQKWNMKFSSWNVNGVRAWVEKNGHSFISAEDPDVFCLQETKCNTENLPSQMKKVPGYKTYWFPADKEGYSGTGLCCKTEPIKVSYGLGIQKHDNEGRVITAEFDKFFFVTAYVPNSGRGLPRLAYRTKEWDVDFKNYLKKLDATKPVIMCGDLNVAHKEIDLANPKTNTKTAGFTKEEREEFTKLLNDGFVDSFRYLYPDTTGAYSYWTYMGNARSKNVGWRLDYFVISERLKAALCDSLIRKDVQGSDHCPITLLLHI